MMEKVDTVTKGRLVNHHQFLQLLAVALAEKELIFLGKVIPEWLELYPGDLQTRLIHACYLYANEKKALAKKLLLQLVELEPAFLPAYLAYHQFDPGNNFVNAAITALGSDIASSQVIPVWAPIVHSVLTNLNDDDQETMESVVSGLLRFSGENALVDLAHLLYAQKYQSDDAVLILARLYHERWKKCLQFKLILADHAMRMGDEVLGLELMQDCAKRDLSGMSVKRLWGEDHPYRQIWPSEDEIVHQLETEIPATLLGTLGWNQLSAGETSTNQEIQNDLDKFENHLSTSLPEKNSRHHAIHQNEEVLSIFDQVSKSLGKKSVRNVDGRYPTYVILTSRKALIEKYGPESTEVIFEQFNILVDSIRQKPGWSGMVFTPDDVTTMKELGMDVRDGQDPWQVKLALIDLDHYLATKGAMIGAILIAGGNDIIPFHQLPNPTDDSDLTVLSDNPYASIDENYFIPEWLIGRMPGDHSNDPGVLLMQLRSAIREHQKTNKQIKTTASVAAFPLEMLIEFFKALFGGQQSVEKTNSAGYSAAIWRRSSIAAYRPIGAANLVMISPPNTTNKIDKLWLSEAEYAYYNLHGIQDGPEWFGQKDFNDSTDGPDYPIALQPGDVSTTPRYRQVIFSEACYGAYIEEKSVEQSIALRFMANGSKAFIGSTCIAYGSIQPPLIGADLLAFLFWKHLQDGYTIGDAFLHAKVELAQEMQKRQEFLDGEDQKTLLSFVLFGDPLAQAGSVEVSGKVKKVEREKLADAIMVFSETDVVAHEPVRISEKTLANVKQALSAYLPGLTESEYDLYQQFIIDTDSFMQKFKYEAPEKLKRHESGNVVLSFRKNIEYQSEQHRYFAKATVDVNGKLIKLAVSR